MDIPGCLVSTSRSRSTSGTVQRFDGRVRVTASLAALATSGMVISWAYRATWPSRRLRRPRTVTTVSGASMVETVW